MEKMEKIKLATSFTLIPEGMHVFKITNVEYKEAFGKILVTLETKEGSRHIERYNLIDQYKQPNTGAINAFSFFARTALQDFTISEIDHSDIVGKFIKGTVTHNKVPSTKKEGEFVTFINIKEKQTANGFEDENGSSASKEIDIDDLLK